MVRIKETFESMSLSNFECVKSCLLTTAPLVRMPYETELVEASKGTRNSCQLHPITMHLSLLLLRLLKHLLDNLLLLDQERANDTVLDTAGASRSTVCSLNGLLWAGDVCVFAGSEGWDTLKLVTTITACNSALAVVLFSIQFQVPEAYILVRFPSS